MRHFSPAMHAAIELNVVDKAVFNKGRLDQHKVELADDNKAEAEFNGQLKELLKLEQAHLHFCAAQKVKMQSTDKQFGREEHKRAQVAATAAANAMVLPAPVALNARKRQRLQTVNRAHAEKLEEHLGGDGALTGLVQFMIWLADSMTHNFFTETMFSHTRNQFLTAKYAPNPCSLPPDLSF